MLLNPQLGAMAIPNLTCELFSVVQLNIPDSRLPVYIVSGYFRFSVSMEAALIKLERILDETAGGHVLIGADVNARSSLWHDNSNSAPSWGRSCRRGALLERVIASHGLVVHNAPDQPATFENHEGATNIDITFSTPGFPLDVINWKVEPDAVDCLHRLISFELATSRSPLISPPTRYNLRDVDWTNFRAAIHSKLQQDPHLPDDTSPEGRIDAVVQSITQLYQEACEETMQRTRLPRSKRTIWWSRSLERMKSQGTRLRRGFQRATDPLIRAARRDAWRRHLEAYKKAVQSARRAAYARANCEDLETNPFGMLYKISSRKYAPKTMLAAISSSSGHTSDIPTTLRAYLDGLVPSTDDSTVTTAPQTDEGSHVNFTRDIITKALNAIKPRKAPGPDNIPGLAIKNSGDLVCGILTALANDCLDAGYFPRAWKIGELRHIPKGPDKDPSQLKSYRPLTMLSEFSKVLERAIKDLIYSTAQAPLSPANQYGFTAGVGTINAMERLNLRIDSCATKYLLALFVDIRGAFDNVRWARVIRRLQDKGVSPTVTRLMASYFSDRVIRFEAEGVQISKLATQGCPQGSILGPDAWNLIVAELLESTYPAGIECIGYADDVAFIIEGCSRTDLERKAAETTSILESWLRLNSLTVSAEKCCYVLFKGNFHRYTSPKIQIQSSRIKRSHEVTYLGIVWDEKRTFRAHVASQSAAAMRSFAFLRRVFHDNWHDRPDALRTIYRGAVVPKMAYGAAIWAHTISRDQEIRRRLLTLQRFCTIAITASAGTVSHAATQVLAAEPPLNMVISEAGARDRILLLRSNTAQHLGRTFHPLRREELCAALRSATMDQWQTEWDAADTGRLTHLYFPSVMARVELHLPLNRRITRVCTGHYLNCADYRARILKLPDEDGLCPVCRLRDTPEHRIISCPYFAEARASLTRSLRLGPADTLLLDNIPPHRAAWRTLEAFSWPITTEPPADSP
ncbi:hypothetical protein M8J76_007107 [Diaphorina citri]|nr:hypothetical protein M8J76_015154 [Diaphorina citri]KAI5703881.1 hypothetical protein M8J76_007107 [Diaphorina citri]